jgi:hypothetical protein
MAEYFEGRALAGTPVLHRCEEKIDRNWGMGSPDPALKPDNFSVRWTGTQTFAAGEYLFIARTDDGVRVWIDNQPLIDKWQDQGPTPPNQATKTLTAGDHQIKMEYYEGGGGAQASLSWQTTASAGPTTCSAGQFLAEYFNNPVLGGTPVLRACEATINHVWGTGGPGAGLTRDFSGRWTGTIDFQAGTYAFNANSDDGIRVWIDGQPLIDAWSNGIGTHRATRALAAGPHQIKVEFFETYGDATVQLNWAAAGP